MKPVLSLMVAMAICLSTMAQDEKSTNKIFNLLVGTGAVAGKSQGIYVYSFNSETGEFSYRAEEVTVKNPSYLAISRDRKNVYSVGEASEGTINAFSFDAATGKLVFVNSASAGGPGPCYVSVDAKKKFVFAGNYSGGSLTAVPINADGSLNQDIQNIQHTGSSVVKPNQEKPHVHATVLSKDDRYLFVPDLGTDKVNIYSVDYSKPKPLAPAEPAFASIAVGGGPRHFVFHPNGKYAYVIHEFTGDITAFDYADGKLKEKQKTSMAPAGFTGKVNAADIHVSPDGKFLYGSMRGDLNELGIYSVDKKGTLTFIGRQSTLGKIPRNFVIDPTGNFLLAANQDSNEIVIFKRDKKTGLLTATGKRIEVGKPMCLKFAAVD
jgi:6-phosphogluconolactonase